jgi:hypothetical protein
MAKRLLDEIAAIQTVDVILPTRCGQKIRKLFVAKPTQHQAILIAASSSRVSQFLDVSTRIIGKAGSLQHGINLIITAVAAGRAWDGSSNSITNHGRRAAGSQITKSTLFAATLFCHACRPGLDGLLPGKQSNRRSKTRLRTWPRSPTTLRNTRKKLLSASDTKKHHDQHGQ